MVCSLNNYILFSMETPAKLVSLARRDLEFFSQATYFKSVPQATRHTVVTCGQYTTIFYKNCSHFTAQARGSLGNQVCYGHEVGVPGWPRISDIFFHIFQISQYHNIGSDVQNIVETYRTGTGSSF